MVGGAVPPGDVEIVSGDDRDDGQRFEDWSKQPDPQTGRPVRFVDRRHGDRRRSPGHVVGLPAHTEPLPTVSLINPTRNEARKVAEVLDQLPELVTEVLLLVDAHSSDVTKLMRRPQPDGPMWSTSGREH